jgi:prevent-host-death family protein
MHTVNIHEAKTHLSRLIERVIKGESFVIAKAGKPLVKVTQLDAPQTVQRLGFMTGEIKVPEDYDRMSSTEIEDLFEGGREPTA